MIFEDRQDIKETISVKYTKLDSVVNYIKKFVSYKMIVYVLILLLTVGTEILGTYPMPYVMLGVATLFNIPLLFPSIIAILGMIVLKIPIEQIYLYVFSSVLYILMTVVINIEGISKKTKIAIKLGSSLLIVSFIFSCIHSFKIEYMLDKLSLVFLIGVLYYVYIHGIHTIFNIDKKMIYSNEELSAMALVITISLMTLVTVGVAGTIIWSIVALTVVLGISYYRGITAGISAGMVVGITMTIITGDVYYAVMFTALSSTVGLLNRIKKIYIGISVVAVSFIVQYIITQNLEITMNTIMIIISASILTLIPKKLDVKLSGLFNQNDTLKSAYEKELGVGSDVKNRLSAMSEVFDNLSSITLKSTEEECTETQKVIEKYLKDYKENNCLNCNNRYYCMRENLDIITGYIARKLEANEPITKSMLASDCDENDKMIKEIKDIYNNIKLMRIIKEKENENNIKLANEYKEVANIIKNMSREVTTLSKNVSKTHKAIREELKFVGYKVYEDNYIENSNNKVYEFITDLLEDVDNAKKEIMTAVGSVVGEKMNIKLILNSSKTEKSRVKLISDGKFVITSEVLQKTKEGNEDNGDSYYITDTKNGNRFIAISDGMGSGEKAKETSQNVINLLEKLLRTGAEGKSATSIINSVVKAREKSNTSATLDITIISPEDEKISMIKMGAAPTYIIESGMLHVIDKENVPLGLDNKVNINKVEMDINKGMLVVNTSDGIDNEKVKTYLKQLSMKDIDLLKNTDILNNIMEAANSQNDDVTIIITKIE